MAVVSLVYQLYRFLFRGGYAADLEALNEVPLRQEGVYAPDARNLKVGDGSTHFNSLPWLLTPWAAGSGTNTITATYTAKPVLFDGMQVRVRAAGANTGAATFNPNSLGAADIRRTGGTALVAGDIVGAGHELLLVYRSSVPCWELINPGTLPASATTIADAGNYFTGGNAEAALQELGASVFGGGGMSLVGSSTVAGSAATTLSISGLDLDADGIYEVELTLGNATASAAAISLYFNADTTATNYDSQVSAVSNNSFSGSRANSARLCDLPASNYAGGKFRMKKDLQGKPWAIYAGKDNTTTSIRQFDGVVVWRTTGTNVTGLTLSSSVANSLSVGSTLKVWKVH